MAKDEPNPLSHETFAAAPPSATGMFRRVLETEPESTAAGSSAQAVPQPATADQALRSQETPASAADTGVQEQGEFTRLFQRVQPFSSESAQHSRIEEMREREGTGEFTRVFRSRQPGENSEGADKPKESAVQQRGFSSPGKSESAAAEGSVTQLFRAPSTVPSMQSVPPAPEQDVAPVHREAPSAFAKAASPAPPAGITNLLESLSMRDRQRPEPATAAPQFPEGAPVESGSVTNFIQKLGEESPVIRQAPARIVEESEPTDPGEFTRMVARRAEKSASPIAAEPPNVKVPAPGATPAARTLPAAHGIPSPPGKPAAPARPRTKLEAVAPVLTAINTVLLIVVLLLLLLRSR